MKRSATVEKRCENPTCGEFFPVPNIRQSRARELLLQFYPCPHCGFVREIQYPRYERPGSCCDCFLAFSLVGYQARGRCNRCLMILLRHEAQAA